VTYRVELDGTWDGFRAGVRGLLAAGVPVEHIQFVDGDAPPGLFGGRPPPTDGTPPALPRAFHDLARRAAAFHAPDRWTLVYRAAWRLARDRSWWDDIADDDMLALRRRAKHVARDVHKMHAFVRFRKVEDDAGSTSWVAFHRPDHHIVALATPHFVRRFGDMRFLIVTPRGSALHTPGQPVVYGPPGEDPGIALGAFEALWSTYYANIYNPGRTMLDAMLAEMPRKHWATLPETDQIPRLLKERAGRLVDGRAAVVLPEPATLPAIARAVHACETCPLADSGRPGVPGEGPSNARIAVVGEQPGDLEDRQGRPFVGPAGQVLMEAFAAVGWRREDVYLTNAVKHFRYRVQGTRRIHENPERYQVEVCRTFVFGELAALRPRVTVALGATAARALLGKVVRTDGPAVHDSRFGPVVVGPHPAAILRRRAPIDPLVATLEHAARIVSRRACSDRGP
jgi:DNA polymerase